MHTPWLIPVAVAVSLAAAPIGHHSTHPATDPPAGAFPAAPDPAATDPAATIPAEDFAVRCGTLHVVAGERVLHDCWLVVRDGRVEAIVEDGTPPEDLPVVDAGERVVMPGLVAADTGLSGHGDDPYNVTPDFSALDGFDFVREYAQALSGGVTSAYLAPGRNRLVPGQGAVVKLAGDDLVARVLAESACLRLTLGPRANAAPPIFEPVLHPTADNPLEPAVRQYPSARISQLDTLRELFRAAASLPEGSYASALGDAADANFVETRYDPTPLRRAARGELPLRVAADAPADVLRALRLARELESVQQLVLEHPLDVAAVADAIADAGAHVVLRMPLRFSANNPGGENRADESPRATPEDPAVLARAGVPVALAAARDSALTDLLLVAAVAVRYGMPPNRALAAVTHDAATALGVADRVGTLEPGMDADFLVLSGEPLAVGTLVEQTWVDGVRHFVRDQVGELLAVRVSSLHTGAGEVLDDGVILVEDGRVKAVGKDLATPYGARVIDLREQGGVMVPGFIDAYSGLGLSGDRSGVPDGAANQQVDRVVRHDDPVFGRALRAGVTTVLSSGTDDDVVSGRVAAIKLGAADHESMIIDPIAGQRFVFDAVGENAIKPLADQIERGKKYLQAWKKYEKALADYEAGKTEKPPEEAEPAPEPAKDDPLSGVWECELAGQPVELVLTLELEGEEVTGTATLEMPGRGEQSQDVSGTFKGKELRLSVQLGRVEAQMVAQIENDSLSGTIEVMGREVQVTGERTAKGADAARPQRSTSKDDGAPTKPKVDQNLEPLKELLEGKATAVIRVDKAPAIRAVVELMRKEEIRFALHGAHDAMQTPELLGDDAVPVLLGPTLVRRERGRVVNEPAAFADHDVPIALATGDVAGSRFLPLHAAHAVRYGLSPQAALRALTLAPAEAFGIADRVGSLARGKDADFAVFTGNPFEATSRPLLVVCNGRVAYDAAAQEAASR